MKNKSSPWITSELRQQIRKRYFLKKQAVKQNSRQAWNDYKKARNEVTAIIREARANFFNDSIKKDSGSLKETWKETAAWLAQLQGERGSVEREVAVQTLAEQTLRVFK